MFVKRRCNLILLVLVILTVNKKQVISINILKTSLVHLIFDYTKKRRSVAGLRGEYL